MVGLEVANFTVVVALEEPRNEDNRFAHGHDCNDRILIRVSKYTVCCRSTTHKQNDRRKVQMAHHVTLVAWFPPPRLWRQLRFGTHRLFHFVHIYEQMGKCGVITAMSRL